MKEERPTTTTTKRNKKREREREADFSIVLLKFIKISRRSSSNLTTRPPQLSSSWRRGKIEALTDYLFSVIRNAFARLANLLLRRFQDPIISTTVDANNKMSASPPTTMTIITDNNQNGGEGCINNGNFLCGVVEGFYGRPWTPDQRKDLFVKMNKMGIGSYLYAPKDDYKHRAFWRDLYSVEEAEQLTSLITAAKENNITFYYALSPGLDMTYSSAKELTFLKRKLEQVAQFGCTAFSLLFDDIEPDMCEADKEIFQSFAHAQVSVTNEVYQHLGQPQFIFCPTEYCSTRAIPTVHASEYLSTIGTKLLPAIDIMWTGSRVITKEITLQSIKELSEVLRRPPVIWDNIHANDYDQKRLFLGPFTGRSPDLIPHLRGLFTNPNCEYEANFVPIHTLAQWSRCSVDGKRDLTNDSISADIKLETESDSGSVEDLPSQINSASYHPKMALKAAINDWLSEFYRPKSSHGKLVKPQLPPNSPLLPAVNTCISVTTTTTTTTVGSGIPILPVAALLGLPEVNASSNFQPTMIPVMNSLVAESDSVVSSINSDEPMDYVPTPSASPNDSLVEGISGDGTEIVDNDDSVKIQSDDENRMQTDPLDNETKFDSKGMLTYDDIELLVDLFYLPFEHGSHGLTLLQDFHWLKNNSHLVIPTKKSQTMSPRIEVQEWQDKAAKFDKMSQAIRTLYNRILDIPNRSLSLDLYPYVWDMRAIVSLLNSYVKWLALGHVPQTVANYVQGPYSWFSQGWKEAFMSGEQEPWVFRGGLSAELQRLLPLENINELCIWKAPDVPSSKTYLIRPYLHSDKSAVYDVCLKTCDDGLDGTDVFPGQPELIGDKLVGSFLTLSSEFCFVLEEDDHVCGYALAALDAKQFYNRFDLAYMPELLAKYPLPVKDSQEMLLPAEEVIAGFHSYKIDVPEVVYKHHPSLIRIGLLPSHSSDPSLVKKLLSCTLSALKANGSYGVYCEIHVGDKSLMDFYSKVGFLEISLGSNILEEVLFFGRTF